MDLSFIAPTIKNGELIVELCKEEIKKETQKWKQALILYVVGGSPTIGVMERYIASVWNFVAKPKVYFHNDGYFVVRFNSIEDRDEVMYSGPHMLNNKPIIVKMWSANFDFNKEVLQTILVWVKYPNLLLNCWENRSLSRISSGLRIPLYVDACTTQVDRISYARVLVEMDVTKELPRSIKVTDPNGREFIQEIAYDWVPEFYTKCMQVGHKCRVDEQLGPKLKAKNEIVVKEQSKLIEPNIEGNASTSTLVASAGIGALKGNKEQVWQTVIRKSVARSRERQPVNAVNVLNGFNLLTESKLQLAMPRQMEEGTSRQRGNNGQEGTMQPLFIPQGPWLIMGDYNAIRLGEDRPIGNPVHELEVKDFNEFIESIGLTEMKTSGRSFTWTNRHTYIKIDKALINAE
nr:uncharacterized protein LOC104088537 [Nicotiana tomentosiformis]